MSCKLPPSTYGSTMYATPSASPKSCSPRIFGCTRVAVERQVKMPVATIRSAASRDTPMAGQRCARVAGCPGGPVVCWLVVAALARKLSMPIRSRMTEWWTTRSIAAIVVMGSLKMRIQSEKTRLVVMMTLRRS